MGFGSLCLSLLVPWFTGACLLRTASRLIDQPLGTAECLGFGYFVGITLTALLFALAGALGLPNSAIWLPAMLLFAALGLTAAYTGRHTGSESSATAGLPSIQAGHRRLISWLLFFACAIHFTCIAVEILHRPVFPWDAWLNWIYRAKAWYFNGEIVAFDSVSDWAAGVSSNKYSVEGNHYPRLVPYVALWSALSLGYWSETLVNIPTLLCGLATVFALFGLAKTDRVESAWLLLPSYFFLSIPLISAHLSLAGQADIWMAGFSGLGSVALVLGVSTPRPVLTWLGLLMLAVSTQVKLEGWLWLLVSIFWLSIVMKPRITLGATALVITAIGLLLATGTTVVNLPFLGKAGIADGTLLLPLFGNVKLMTFALADDYLINFFMSGTWNFFWIAVIISSSIGLYRRTKEINLGSSLFLFLLVAQFLLFYFTGHGTWADDWTAINRLPIQLAPLGIWIVTVAVNGEIQSSAKTDWTTKLIPGVALVLVTTAALLIVLNQPNQKGESLVIPGSTLTLRTGSGQVKNQSFEIDGFDRGAAIVSRDGLSIDSTQKGLLRLRSHGENRQHMTFFWRNASNPDELHSIRLSGVGDHNVLLTSSSNWNGRVTEIGLVTYADSMGGINIDSISIDPLSFRTRLLAIAEAWTTAVRWEQRSVNWLPTDNGNIAVSLQDIGLTLIPVALFIAFLLRRLNGGTICQISAMSLILVWAALDVQWMWRQVNLASDTTHRYALSQSEYFSFGDDKKNYELAALSKRLFPEEAMPITLLSDLPQEMRFDLLRMRYHLLPRPSHVHLGSIDKTPTNLGNNFVLVRSKERSLDDVLYGPISNWLQKVNAGGRDSLRIVATDENAAFIARSETSGKRLEAPKNNRRGLP